MQYNRVGKSELTVSAVGLGGWALGGGTDWGPADEAAARQTVFAALEAGITLFDTAPIYGESEVFLGRALQTRRRQVVLATKCGLIKNGSWTDHDLRPSTIRLQLEQSLSRLQTDYIDLYQIHYPDPKVPLNDALDELLRLQEQGKIRYIGLCNAAAQQIRAAEGKIISLQEELSLLHSQKAAALQPVCRELNLGLMGYGTLCGGILSGKYKKEPNLRRADARNYFYKCYRGESFSAAQQVAARVQQVARRREMSPAAVSGSWALAQPAVCTVLMGARTPVQIKQNAAAASFRLNPEEIQFLEDKK